MSIVQLNQDIKQEKILKQQQEQQEAESLFDNFDQMFTVQFLPQNDVPFEQTQKPKQQAQQQQTLQNDQKQEQIDMLQSGLENSKEFIELKKLDQKPENLTQNYYLRKFQSHGVNIDSFCQNNNYYVKKISCNMNKKTNCFQLKNIPQQRQPQQDIPVQDKIEKKIKQLQNQQQDKIMSHNSINNNNYLKYQEYLQNHKQNQKNTSNNNNNNINNNIILRKRAHTQNENYLELQKQQIQENNMQNSKYLDLSQQNLSLTDNSNMVQQQQQQQLQQKQQQQQKERKRSTTLGRQQMQQQQKYIRNSQQNGHLYKIIRTESSIDEGIMLSASQSQIFQNNQNQNSNNSQKSQNNNLKVISITLQNQQNKQQFYSNNISSNNSCFLQKQPFNNYNSQTQRHYSSTNNNQNNNNIGKIIKNNQLLLNSSVISEKTSTNKTKKSVKKSQQKYNFLTQKSQILSRNKLSSEENVDSSNSPIGISSYIPTYQLNQHKFIQNISTRDRSFTTALTSNGYAQKCIEKQVSIGKQQQNVTNNFSQSFAQPKNYQQQNNIKQQPSNNTNFRYLLEGDDKENIQPPQIFYEKIQGKKQQNQENIKYQKKNSNINHNKKPLSSHTNNGSFVLKQSNHSNNCRNSFLNSYKNYQDYKQSSQLQYQQQYV